MFLSSHVLHVYSLICAEKDVNQQYNTITISIHKRMWKVKVTFFTKCINILGNHSWLSQLAASEFTDIDRQIKQHILRACHNILRFGSCLSWDSHFSGAPDITLSYWVMFVLAFFVYGVGVLLIYDIGLVCFFQSMYVPESCCKMRIIGKKTVPINATMCQMEAKTHSNHTTYLYRQVSLNQVCPSVLEQINSTVICLAWHSVQTAVWYICQPDQSLGCGVYIRFSEAF